jgi:hypothetical protein
MGEARRRAAAVLAAALLLSGAAVVTTAPPAGAAANRYASTGVPGLVVVVRWTTIEVTGSDLRRRRLMVRLTQAIRVERGAVTGTTPVRPQLTPPARPAQDRTTAFVRVFEQ